MAHSAPHENGSAPGAVETSYGDRIAITYDAAPAPRDPDTTSSKLLSWPIIAFLLILLFPIGLVALWLRRDIGIGVRLAVSVVAAAVFVATLASISAHL